LLFETLEPKFEQTV